MNDIETKKTIRKIQTKSWFFEKIYKHVARAIEKESKKTLTNAIRKEEKL